MSIPHLQLATAFAWFLVVLVTVPGTLRLFLGRHRAGDACKSVFFFTALVMIGGSSRWLLRPDDVTAWKLIYALTILLAFYTVVITWNMRRDRNGGR